MSNSGTRSRRRAIARVALSVLQLGVLGLGSPFTAAAQSRGETVTADVAVEVAIVAPDGTAKMTKVLSRSRISTSVSAGGSTFEMQYLEEGGQRVADRRNPLPGRRYVLDESGNMVIYSADGGVISRRPGQKPEMLPAGMAAGGGSSLLLPRSAGARLAEVRTQVGRREGKVGVHERYITDVPQGVRETLLNPELGAPEEVNETRDGLLVSHTKIRYGTVPDGRRYIAVTTHEQPLGDGSADRIITRTTYSNVAVARRGR